MGEVKSPPPTLTPTPEPRVPGPPGYFVSLSLLRCDLPEAVGVALRGMRAPRQVVGAGAVELRVVKPLRGPWEMFLAREQPSRREHVSVVLEQAEATGRVEARVSHITEPACTGEVHPWGTRYRSTFDAPRVVASLIEHFGAVCDRPVLLVPRMCDGPEARPLAEYVGSRERTMPLLVLSLSRGGWRELGEVDAVARRVAGLAHVFVLADGNTAERFAATPGPWVGRTGGGVRIFWPEAEEGDAPNRHFFWDAHVVRYDRRSFELELLQTLSYWWRDRESGGEW